MASNNGNGRIRSLRILDFSDRDLLAIVDDNTDEDGWARTEDIAAQIFPRAMTGEIADQNHAMRCVGIRFAWMRRYGVLEKHPNDAAWQLTPDGVTFLEGRLPKGQENALKTMSEGELLAAMSTITSRYKRTSQVGATMLRREWSYGTGRRY